MRLSLLYPPGSRSARRCHFIDLEGDRERYVSIVLDDLEEMQGLRGSRWREEVAAKGRGVKRKTR